jgi:hypothetical protein
MVTDVDWPNGWEGGHLTGHDEVRAYWTRQWAEIDSSAEPLAITKRRDGHVQVRVHLVGRNPAGDVLFDEEALHVYAFRDELVERMAIEHPESHQSRAPGALCQRGGHRADAAGLIDAGESAAGRRFWALYSPVPDGGLVAARVARYARHVVARREDVHDLPGRRSCGRRVGVD